MAKKSGNGVDDEREAKEFELLKRLERVERHVIELAVDRQNAARDFSEQRKTLDGARTTILKEIEELRLGIRKLPMPELVTSNDQVEEP
jgi:hypothetical protein